jgi:hypothetical protein
MKQAVLKITPTKSVIEGWNGTVEGLRALAVSLAKPQLYKHYALFHESVEDFEKRMKREHGVNWAEKLLR